MKSGIKRVGDLEIEQDLSYQKKAWAVERAAFLVFCVVLIAALLGLFGKGALSHRQKRSPDHVLTLDYERFLQWQSPESIELRIASPGGQDVLEVWIGMAYVGAVTIQQVAPEPESVRVEADCLVYKFSVPRSNAVVRAKFRFQPEKPGSLSGLVGIENGARLAFEQFVYP